MKTHKVITVKKREHVVCDVQPRDSQPMPNYRGTHMALCGILKKGESLESFLKRRR